MSKWSVVGRSFVKTAERCFENDDQDYHRVPGLGAKLHISDSFPSQKPEDVAKTVGL